MTSRESRLRDTLNEATLDIKAERALIAIDRRSLRLAGVRLQSAQRQATKARAQLATLHR